MADRPDPSYRLIDKCPGCGEWTRRDQFGNNRGPQYIKVWCPKCNRILYEWRANGQK